MSHTALSSVQRREALGYYTKAEPINGCVTPLLKTRLDPETLYRIINVLHALSIYCRDPKVHS